VPDIDSLLVRLGEIHAAYDEAKLRWCAAFLAEREGIDLAAVTDEQLATIVTDWRDAALKLNKLILLDARKEFDPFSKTGFGIDGDDDVAEADFQAVRGTLDDNAFVRGLHDEARQIAARAEALLAGLGQA